MISKVLHLLISLTPSVLSYKRSEFKAKRNLRNFIEFINHTFRFLIVCQSIDHQCLSRDSTLSMTLSQALRKLELFKKVFPQNAPLIDSLKSDSSMILWFRHNDGKGCHLNDFYISRKFQNETMENSAPIECGNCGVQESLTLSLMKCGRCLKVYYCSVECQKENYRVHKRYCLSLSQEAEMEAR